MNGPLLSDQFKEAYAISYRSSKDDTDPVVRKARTKLRTTVRKKMEKKLKDVSEICEASQVVSTVHTHIAPIRDQACSTREEIRRHLWLLKTELARLKTK